MPLQGLRLSCHVIRELEGSVRKFFQVRTDEQRFLGDPELVSMDDLPYHQPHRAGVDVEPDARAPKACHRSISDRVHVYVGTHAELCSHGVRESAVEEADGSFPSIARHPSRWVSLAEPGPGVIRRLPQERAGDQDGSMASSEAERPTGNVLREMSFADLWRSPCQGQFMVFVSLSLSLSLSLSDK